MKKPYVVPWSGMLLGLFFLGILVCGRVQGQGAPDLSRNPWIYFHYDSTTDVVTCYCHFYKLAQNDVWYKVQFFVNDREAKVHLNATGTVPLAMSESEYGVGGIGVKTYCNVTPCFASSCETTLGKSFKSNVITADVEVHTPTVYVWEARVGANIKLLLPVPPMLFCPPEVRRPANRCYVKILTHFTDTERTCPDSNKQNMALILYSLQTQHIPPFCGIPITMSNWVAPFYIPVHAAINRILDGAYLQRTLNISVEPICNGKSNNTSIADKSVKVYVSDGASSICKSINDPHITTFDGWHIDNFLEGEFIFYIYKSGPYEVRTFYRRCDEGNATCNCAVAVKSGDDVIVFDKCGPTISVPGTFKPLKITLYLNGQLTKGTRIFSFGGGQKYNVYLPHGSVVTIENGKGNRPNFLNIWYRTTPADWKNSRGLCGLWNNIFYDDGILRDGSWYGFNENNPERSYRSWRINETIEQSLYKGFCPDDFEADPTYSFCVCNVHEADHCSVENQVQDCFPALETKNGTERGKDITAELLENNAEETTKCFLKESASASIFKYDPSHNAPTGSWPTPSNITEAEAMQYCSQFVTNSSAGNMCKGYISSTFVNNALQDCVTDIKLTDDKSWAEETLRDILYHCKSDLIYKSTQWETVDGEWGPPRDKFGIICPNDCSGHGTCKEGVCNCYGEEYVGYDCSIPAMSPPELFSIQGSSMIDLDEGPVKQLSVYGVDFVDSSLLTCHYILPSAEEMKVSAYYLTKENIYCPWINITGSSFHLSVSNNGVNASRNQLYLGVYNSVCHRCFGLNGAFFCTNRSDVCLIDDQADCCLEGYINSNNATEVCDPSVSTRTWIVLNRSEIKIRRYGFLSLVGNRMNTLTPSVWFTVYGSTPIGQGPTGVAIWLDGVNQYIDMINQSSPCLYDLLKCRYGLTVIFNLYLQEFRTKMYIFTNGGDETGFYGMSMWHERKRLFLSISTKSKIWNVNTKFITLRKYIKIQFSWSPQFGIRLYFDDVLVVRSSRFYKRSANNLADKFTIGCSLHQQYFARMAIEGWNVVEAFIDTMKAYNISFDVPELTEDPILEFKFNETSQDAKFLCTINPGLSDIQYTVRWYQNDDIIKEDNLIGRTAASLIENDIAQLFYEDQIKCSVSPCVPGNCESLRGSWKHSNAFIAKVQVVSETQIIIHEGSDYATINVTSNIPPTFFCSMKSRNANCEVAISTELAKYWWDFKCPGSLCPVSQVVFGMYKSHNYHKPCSHLITMDTWHSGVLIPVKAAIDTLVDGYQTRHIRVHFTTVNETKLISTLQVTVVDKDKIAVCSSINDPHITTFDSKYYDNYLEGEFILYRHKSLPYEVRSFYRRCNGIAACNCAVVTRSGDDVIIVDVCGPTAGKSRHNTPYTLKMYLNGDLTPGTEVIRKAGGKTYEIILPTGTKVLILDGWVLRGSQFINVKIVASTADYNNTEGLCGTFDGDYTNELTTRQGTIYRGTSRQPNEFSLSWRVSDDESLYQGYCGTVDSTFEIRSYCDCMEGQTAMCQEGMDLMKCVEIEKRRGLLDGKRGIKRLTPDLVRDAESPPNRCTSDRLPEDFEYDPEYKSPDPLSNITEPVAKEICENFMKSKESGKECMELPGLDVTPIVQGCIADLQITGDTDWAKESLDNLQEECKVIVEGSNITNITYIIGIICPNSCSDNGNCTEGFCECTYPWIGDDCSVNSTAPPTLFQVGTGEPCDTICFNCSFVKLYGDDFADSENLTCHYRTLDMNLSAVSDVMTSKAEYFNRRIVTCYFSSVGIYEVAVSNDGEITSEYKIYVIYNSYCQHCTNIGCTKRTDGCRIDGTCLLDGFVNTQNISQTCEVAVSSSSWSTWNVEDITIQNYLFKNQEVIKDRYNISVGGSDSLEFVETCVIGEDAVFLNGSQYLSFGDVTDSCLGDLEKCKHGVTFRFNVKFMTQSSKCYVFSNGGDSASTYGHAMWMENGRLYARTTNRKNEWVIASSSFKMEEFLIVEMSWSLQSGLYLSFNEQVIGSRKNCIHRPVSNYTVFSDFIIGASSKKDQHCRMVIEYFTVLFGYNDIVDSTGIKPGKPCEGTSTKAIPTSLAFSTSEALTESTISEMYTVTVTSLPLTDSATSLSSSVSKTTVFPDIYGSSTATTKTQLTCGSAAQMSSADAVITSTSITAGILFIIILILFIFTCRRKQKKKKRFLQKHGSDFHSIERKGFFTNTMWIPFWRQRGHTFLQYKTTSEIPISDSRGHRYQTHRETVQYAPSATGDSRMYTNRAYEEDYVTVEHAMDTFGARQSSAVYDNARNSHTFGSESIEKKNGKIQNNSVYLSRLEKRQCNSWSHTDHRINGKKHSNAEGRITEKTVWVPAETEDVAVYQVGERQRKDKTEVNMSEQKTEREEDCRTFTSSKAFESTRNTDIASNVNSNQSTHYSTQMLLPKGEMCPYCIHAQAEGSKIVHRVSTRKGNSVDSSSQTDFAYEIRSSVSTEETNINLKDVDQSTYASIYKGDDKSLTKTDLSLPQFKTNRVQYGGVGKSQKLVKTSESDNDERIRIGDKRKALPSTIEPSLGVGKRIHSETNQNIFEDGSSSTLLTGSEMHHLDDRVSQVFMLKRMQSNSNYGKQGFGVSAIRTDESYGDHKTKIIHGENKSSISDMKVGEMTSGNQQESVSTTVGMLEKKQSIFEDALENNREEVEYDEEESLKTLNEHTDSHVSSVQLPNTGQSNLIFIKACSESSFIKANRGTKMNEVHDGDIDVSMNVYDLKKAESETGAIIEEKQLESRGDEIQEQNLWFQGDSDEDLDQSGSTLSEMLEKTTNFTEYDKTGSSKQKEEHYEIVTAWLPYEKGQEGHETAHQLSEERKTRFENSESFGLRQEVIQRDYMVQNERSNTNTPLHNQHTSIYKREVVPFRYNADGKEEYMDEENNLASTQSLQDMNILAKVDEKNVVFTTLYSNKPSYTEGSGQTQSSALKMEQKIEIGKLNGAQPHAHHVGASEKL